MAASSSDAAECALLSTEIDVLRENLYLRGGFESRAKERLLGDLGVAR
jgi:hypothetical protein